MNDQEIKDLVYKFGERAVSEFSSEDVASLTPQRVDNYLSILSGYSALLEEELGDLELEQAQTWPAIREKHKTSVQADNEWRSTKAGLRQIKIARTLKSVDKIIAACKHRLERLKMESYNRY